MVLRHAGAEYSVILKTNKNRDDQDVQDKTL